MIRYRLWVWVLCLVFPTWVWAENETRTCTSFTQQGRQVTFHLTDGDGPVQSGTVRYKMEFSEFAGLLYPIIGGGDSRSICRRDWTKNRPNDGCGTIGTN